jgi:Tfp pilus assembly protein PilV
VFDPNEKNKHKFMVQSMIRPDSDLSVDQLWKEVSADQLMDSKLRCVFELPVDNSQQSATVQSVSATTTTAISQATSEYIYLFLHF